MPYVIGIDPGHSGAVCQYDYGSGVDTIRVFLLPVMKAGGTKTELDIALLRTRLEDGFSKSLSQVNLVVLERVGPMRHKNARGELQAEGLTSTFTFGTGYGELRGVLKWTGLPYQLVQPQSWKAVVLSGTTKDKAAAVAHVKRRFPVLSLLPTPRCHKPHEGMADAVCLALYGRHILQGASD